MGQTEQEQQNALTKKKRPKMSRVPSRSGSKLSGRSRTKTGSTAPTEKSGVSLPTRSNNTHWQTKLCLADTAVPSKSGVTGSRRDTTSASRSSRKSRTRSMSEFKSYVNGGSQFVDLARSSKSAITKPGQTKSWRAVTRSTRDRLNHGHLSRALARPNRGHRCPRALILRLRWKMRRKKSVVVQSGQLYFWSYSEFSFYSH